MKKMKWVLPCVAMLISGWAVADLTVSEVQHTAVPKIQRIADCQVSTEIARNQIPTTPNNMSLPEFGQGIIGWGTGPDGAQAKLNTLHLSDIEAYKAKGVTVEILKEWQAFYQNETRRNSCNPTAPIRATLMSEILKIWL